jgi:hypothetical protein
VIHDYQTYSIDSSHPNWELARQAIIDEDWNTLVTCLDIIEAVRTYTQGYYEITEEGAFYQEELIPGMLQDRLISMMKQGANFEFLLQFHQKLQKNPSHATTTGLYDFLEHKNIPIGPDGCFYAYKGVRNDMKDCHSGKFDNSPGQRHEMPRNKVDDNRSHSCSSGFHVGSLKYATGFGPTTVIVKVDPADVVSIPTDSSCQKVRTCKYEVVGMYEGPLPSTTYDHEEGLEDDYCGECGEHLDYCYCDDESEYI